MDDWNNRQPDDNRETGAFPWGSPREAEPEKQVADAGQPVETTGQPDVSGVPDNVYTQPAQPAPQPPANEAYGGQVAGGSYQSGAAYRSYGYNGTVDYGTGMGYAAAGQGQTAQAQNIAASAGPVAPGTGWQYYNGQWYVAQPPADGQTTPPTPPRETARQTGEKKSGGKVALAAVAVALACAVSGFGGVMAGVSLAGEPQTTVVYRTPDEDLATAASGGEVTVSDVAAKAGESVVSITTENLVSNYQFGGYIAEGAGSGVIISEDGVILTNHHVVEGARHVVVTLPDGSEYEATVLGSDASTDVALVKIQVTGLTPAVIGDSDNLRVGEACLAIGNPLGTLGGTVTDGIISALDRPVQLGNYTMNLLQTSAAISPGNSGGGLFNMKGELIGVVNSKKAAEGVEGLGFAIPVNTAMEVAAQVLEHGRVIRPGLGVTVLTVSNQAEAEANGFEQPGLYIASVSAGGAAGKVGIQPMDRVVEADGNPVMSYDDLSKVIAEKAIGDQMELVVEREGERLTFQVILEELVG